MASAYIKVKTFDNNGNIKVWRTFGGNRADVKRKMHEYKKFTYIQALKQHSSMTFKEFLTLHVSYHTKN